MNYPFNCQLSLCHSIAIQTLGSGETGCPGDRDWVAHRHCTVRRRGWEGSTGGSSRFSCCWFGFRDVICFLYHGSLFNTLKQIVCNENQQIISDLQYPNANSAYLNEYYLLTLLLSQLNEGDLLVNFKLFKLCSVRSGALQFPFGATNHKHCTCVVFSLMITGNVSWAPNQHIRMISEGSCDTGDLSNGCWKFSFAITGINCLKYIKILK